ncbi:hypothetical protein Dsin_012909 [Dipteronia sinensis]|uniref:Uncharacterized protein n=1 Tax=Dipteronia sinensis TaxID=43782 RepID=A0AAE0AK68_9ROSI|nr:hypothetical protein Dsin_012909 [Dipteronia sinensis]
MTNLGWERATTWFDRAAITFPFSFLIAAPIQKIGEFLREAIRGPWEGGIQFWYGLSDGTEGLRDKVILEYLNSESKFEAHDTSIPGSLALPLFNQELRFS